MNSIKKSPLLFAYILLLIVMIVLPFFSVPSFVIWKNTTSHLGAQNAPNSWIMNLTFILLGITTFFEAWKKLGDYLFHRIYNKHIRHQLDDDWSFSACTDSRRRRL